MRMHTRRAGTLTSGAALMAAALASACVDDHVPAAPNSEPVPGLLRNGAAQVTVEYSRDLPETDMPPVSFQTKLTLAQGQSGPASTRISVDAELSRFGDPGADNVAEIDASGRVYVLDGGGAPVDPPDLEQVVSELRGDVAVDMSSGAKEAFFRELLRRRGASGETRRSRELPAFSAPQSPVHAGVTGEQGAAQLGYLRENFVERRIDAERVRFTRDLDAGGSVEVEFNEKLGAVTRLAQSENGKLVSVTQQEYLRQGGIARLARIVTTIYGEDGREQRRYVVSIGS